MTSTPRRRVRARGSRILPWPMPCSPVQVPSMAMARMLSRATNSSASSISFGSFDVHQHQHMEIAVADMADDRRDQAHLGDIGLGLGDAFGKPRDRHADIGRRPARAGPQRQRRPIGVVPRLPQLRRAPRRRWSTGTARRHMSVGDLAEGFAPARRRRRRCRGTPGTGRGFPDSRACE